MPAGTVFLAQRYEATGIGNSTKKHEQTVNLDAEGQVLLKGAAVRSRRQRVCPITDFPTRGGTAGGFCCLPSPNYRVPGGSAAALGEGHCDTSSPPEQASEVDAGSEDEIFQNG